MTAPIDRRKLASVETVGGTYFIDHVVNPEGRDFLDVYSVFGPSPTFQLNAQPATPEGMKAALELITEKVVTDWRDEIAAEESEQASSL